MQQFVDAPLKRAIFGAKTVRGNVGSHRRHADEQRVRFHPPCQPRFQLRLPPEFIHQVAIIIKDRTIGDHVRRVPRGSKFRGNLRVQNPQLPFDGGRGIHRKRRLARDLRHQLHVQVRLLQQRANFIRQRRLAHSVRPDQREFQFSASHQQRSRF